VDDQPLQRQLLAGLLVPLGFIVREAASGRECVEIVRQGPPDLVLLDISMDDLDGWQTAALLRTLAPAEQLPIVFVSANQFDHEPGRLAAVQVQGFVGKPVVESELLRALQAALHLEWVHDNTPQPALAATALAGASPAAPTTLPQALRDDLTRLARQGQAAAVREMLRRARTELPPQHAQALALLQACADRFDFEALALHLREPDHAAIH
jgi:CheY-like chemotaxis protein